MPLPTTNRSFAPWPLLVGQVWLDPDIEGVTPDRVGTDCVAFGSMVYLFGGESVELREVRVPDRPTPLKTPFKRSASTLFFSCRR